MERKMNFENLRGFEFECEKCGCVVRTGTGRETMFDYCPDCGERFGYNRNNDPIARIAQAIEAFEKVSSVKVRLICEEEA
jgi:predicted  nucleic acid-binding Zn-ribbon protein